MRILHVIRGLNNSSGTTHIVGPLAEAQARLGHSVRVLFVEKPLESPVVPNAELVESFGFPMTVNSTHFGWSRPFARAMRGAVQEADIVHVHAIWNYPTLRAMREAYRAGVPYVVAPQGSLEDWAMRRPGRRLKRVYMCAEKRYFDRATAMQVLTDAEAEQCRRFGIVAPPRILPNGVDLASVDSVKATTNLRAEFSLPEDSLVYVFIGRLVPKKGLDLLIRGFARLAAERPEAFLLIAGHDGRSGYRAELERLSEGVSGSRIRFVGELRGERKFEFLRGGDVFVLTSYSEGLPVAALESMACRLPSVVTPGCHLPEIETCRAGWTVEPTVGGVHEGLVKAAASARERQWRGSNARSLVESKFNWERVASQSLVCYQGGA